MIVNTKMGQKEIYPLLTNKWQTARQLHDQLDLDVNYNSTLIGLRRLRRSGFIKAESRYPTPCIKKRKVLHYKQK